MERQGSRAWGWQALPPPLRAAIVFVLYLGAYLLLDVVAAAFTIGPDAVASVWHLPSALTIVVLWVFGLRYSVAAYLAVLVAGLLNAPDVPVLALVVHAFTYTFVYGAAVFALDELQVNPRLYSVRDVSWFMLVAAFLAPLAAGILAMTTFALFGLVAASDWLVQTLQFVAGDATGIAALAPFLLVVLRYAPSVWTDDLDLEEVTWRWPAARAWARGAAFVGLLALAAFVAYRVPENLSLDHSYVVFIPVVWIAARYGFAWSTAAILSVNIFIALFSFTKLGEAEGFALQFGLGTLTFTGVLLSAVVTGRDHSEARLRYHAFHDPLTDLPNRALLLERLEHALARSRRGDRLFALLFVDIDHFKGINDSFGHAFGDAVLRQIAATLQNSVRPGDTVARLGGDEFVVLLGGVVDVAEAVAVSGRVRAALAQPQWVEGQEIRVNSSIGIAPSPETQQSPDDLLRSAGTALGRAKLEGRARYVVFDETMYEQARERLQLETDLRRAVERGELVLHYQPIVLLGSERVVGAEALLRWQHPERGLLAPDRFVPLAEETGLIVPVGAWVMREAFCQTKRWHDAGAPHLYIAINLSARQVQHPDLRLWVEEALQACALSPDHVVLELTESMVMAGVAASLLQLEGLRSRGVGVAIDDFGTGYSSLAYLKTLPIDTLKIDRSFLLGLPADTRDVGIIRAIVALAHDMKLAVIAEGVETPAQAHFLQEHDCAQGQGFLFSRPLTAAGFTELLEGGEGG